MIFDFWRRGGWFGFGFGFGIFFCWLDFVIPFCTLFWTFWIWLWEGEVGVGKWEMEG